MRSPRRDLNLVHAEYEAQCCALDHVFRGDA